MIIACKVCWGSGTIKDSWNLDGSGNLEAHDEPCLTCGGSGFVDADIEETPWKD